MADPIKFRLDDTTLERVDALAASNGGNRTLAIKESVAYWHSLVEQAARENADALTVEEWALLGRTQTGSDDDEVESLLREREGPGRPTLPAVVAVDWCQRLALELAQMHEGRDVVLHEHKEERRAAKKLAKKIAGWGVVRGYALYAALRYFWRRPEAGIAACAAPEVWLTPTARE